MRWVGGLIFGLAIVLALGGWWMVNGRTGNGGPRVAAARDSFASDRDAAPERIDFDAARALGYVKDLCRIGPRISGSEGMKRQQELLTKHFTDLGGQVRLQPFTARQRSRKEPTAMANLIVSWHTERPRRVILCAHYDTRPIADNERDPRKWREPFLSANDGGSGVALLMELAHHMKELKTEVGVDFVFFDGEEYIFEREGDKYFFGSEYFSQEYRRTQPRQRYVKAILLDMIGGKDAHFPGEQNSLLSAGPFVQEIWKIAAEQKCTAFRNEVGPAVLDDHLALNKVGIPAIDIVDLDYPHWHKLSDIPENCSEESIAQVARVLIVWLQRVK
jgi:hypothetical protein